MIEIADMPKLPKGLSDQEFYAILTGNKGPTKMKHFRLSEEACRILTSEAKQLGVDDTKALELLLREIRELRKKKR